MKKLIYLLALSMLVSGCATLVASTMSQATFLNRQNLLKLNIGMTKAEAITTMGTKPIIVYSGGVFGTQVQINNPYRSEILSGEKKNLEVIYYATDVKADENYITDDELTPLVFSDGKLIGWGQSLLQDNVQKYEIRAR